jgi:hypothetical protein
MVRKPLRAATETLGSLPRVWDSVACSEGQARDAPYHGVCMRRDGLVGPRSIGEIGTENTGRQCPPDSASADGNPADPAVADTNAEPSRVEIRANPRREINAFPNAQFH